MNIPTVLTAGDTLAWTDSLADYPATIWTLRYSLWRYGKSVISIPATASGTDHAIAVSAATSKAYAPGGWKWTAYVEKGSGATYERKTVATGNVTIKPDMSAATSTTDLRSHAQIMLEAIEALLQGRATKSQAALAINGKSIQYLKPEEIERWRGVYTREVKREKGESSIVGIQFRSA